MNNSLYMYASIYLLGSHLSNRYSIDFNFTSNLETSLVDYVGMTYDVSKYVGGVAFTLTEDVSATSFIGITEDNSVGVSYKLNVESDSPPRSGASRSEPRSVYRGMVMFLLGAVLPYCVVF